MADSASNLSYEKEYFPSIAAPVKSAEVMVMDGFCSIALGTGLIENAGTAVDMLPVGMCVGDFAGKNSPAGMTGNATGTVKVTTKSGEKLINKSVTGVAAITDFGKNVYATDNQTLTLTKPTAGIPIGFVAKWNATTYCDIQTFTPAELLMWSFLPQKETIYLGYVSSQAMGGTAAIDLFSYTANRRMQIDTFKAYPMFDDAAVAGDQDLNLEIGAVDVTGSDLTLAYTDCDAAGDMGTASSAACTALNIVSQGEVITVEMAASGTGFTNDIRAGFNLYIDVTYLPGS